jgi:eukaryotic-like serine/threonine-protein kinase
MPITLDEPQIALFESASSLREEHANLLDSLDKLLGKDTSEENELASLVHLEPQIRDFISRGVATGIYLDEIEDRTACQVLLDYWVSSLFRAGISIPGARLAKFDSDKLPVLKEEDCPYMGLEAFRENTYFFGRESDTRALLELVRATPLVVVVGASGSGKSSIVMGGVLPALQEKSATPELNIVQPFVPGYTVLENLVNAVLHGKPDANIDVGKEVSLLRHDSKHLCTMLGGEKALPTLITIDQFEEIFTLSKSADSEALVANLEQLLEADSSHRVILTVRQEFKDQIVKFRALSPYLVNKAWYSITPMVDTGLKAAVEKPAMAVNLQFQAGIVEDLVTEVVGQPTALPLLQLTLKLLWKKRKRNRITWEVYNEVGKPLKALGDWADSFYYDHLEVDDKEEAKRILLELVRVDEILEAYRQPVAMSQLLLPGKANTKKVLALLDKNDFVRITPGISDTDTVVEVKHESLIRNWPTYVGWIKDKRDERSKNIRNKLILTRRAAVFFATVVAVLICGIILHRYLYVWDYHNYYNKIVKVYGIPVGCGKELKKNQYEARTVSLRIVRKGRWGDQIKDVLRMEAVDGAGMLTPYHNVGTYFDPYSKQISPSRECKWEYVRDSDGEIVYEKAYDKDDKLVWILIYSPPAETQSRENIAHKEKIRVRDVLYLKEAKEHEYRILKKDTPSEFKPSDIKATLDPMKPASKEIEKRETIKDGGSELREPARNITAAIPFVFSESKIASIQYSSNGYETEIRYYDHHRKPIAGPDNAFGKKLTYHKEKAEGLVDEQTSLDRYGKPMNDEDGNATFKMTYDEMGNIVMGEALDKQRVPIILKKGYHRFRARYDDRGNRTEWAYFGLNGEPVLNQDGYHKGNANFDARGNQIEWLYFALNNAPVLYKEGYHKVTADYDARYNQTERAYYGVNGEPILFENKYHKITGKFDSRNNRTEWAYYGLNGEPTLFEKAYHKVTGKFDSRNNRTEWAYYGLNGEPTLFEKSYHKAIRRYDDRRMPFMIEFFGLKEEPVLHKDGYHKDTSVYDSRGNLAEHAYFGLEGEPILFKKKYHKTVHEYDESGNRTISAYFGVNGEPILFENTYHKVTGKFDDRGNRIESMYFGLKGEPILFNKEYHKATSKYDERGNRIESMYFGLKGEPILFNKEYHRATYKFDEWGNRTESIYFGVNGESVLFKKKYHKIIGKYDDRGNRIEWAYFGLKGEPIHFEKKYHRVTGKYDDNGNQIEWAYFGLKGEPIYFEKAYHKLTVRYDASGKPIVVAYFGLKGEPIFFEKKYHRVTGKYDDNGNQIEWAYFGLKGEPIYFESKYHKITGRFDDRGNRVETAYYDIHDNPIMVTEGYFRLVQRFGANKELLEMSTFDTSGNLVINELGFARVLKKYDKSGNLIEITAFGTDDKLKVAHYGYARLTHQYDVHGNMIEEAYFGADNKPITSGNGCARLTYKYDTSDKKVGFCCHDVRGGPVWCK